MWCWASAAAAGWHTPRPTQQTCFATSTPLLLLAVLPCCPSALSPSQTSYDPSVTIQYVLAIAAAPDANAALWQEAFDELLDNALAGA